MSVSLRDRLYNDTGGVVQGATVQAILVTGGGTDAGVSSAVVASTTTDVNGVWKFTALADPGVGNWYDVKLANGNQVIKHYGNIQTGISLLNLATDYTVPSGHTWDFSSATVVLGAVTVSDPKLTGQVTKGSGVQTLPTVSGNTGKWRFYKATATMTITPFTGQALIAPGEAAARATNATYSSPAGESTGWYCDGTNWMCI